MLSDGVLLQQKYKIINMIKHPGGMGVVYRAENIRTKEKCAVKEPLFNGQNDDLKLEKLRMEAEILRRLNHRHIVKYMDSFEDKNTFFLVEEYIDGESLREIYLNNPCPEDRAVVLTKQILVALEYLHNNNVIHRDIKPSNLMVDGNRLCLIDFGAGKYFNEFLKQCRNCKKQVDGKLDMCPYCKSPLKGTIIFAPGYAPWEQEEGYAYPQSDIYAVGRTLFFMLTGKDLSISINNYPPDFSPKRLNPNISDRCAYIVLKACKHQRYDRFSTATEMMSAFDGIPVQPLGPRVIVGSKIYPISDYMRIGTRENVEISLPASSSSRAFIDPIHMIIQKTNEGYMIKDNSTFGTFVDEGRGKILLSSKKNLLEYYKVRGYQHPANKLMHKWLLKDKTTISLAWDPQMGDYLTMEVRLK